MVGDPAQNSEYLDELGMHFSAWSTVFLQTLF